jgi:DNA-binding NarL/FixJ family response regulator
MTGKITKNVIKPSPNILAIRVSIVEDDSPIREILRTWLNRAEGFEVVSAFGCAEDSLTQLPQQKPDVVLMDIKLPGVNGVECVRRLKPQLPLTQFVMHTVYEDSNHIFNALQSGATGYLLKQTPHDELLIALKYVHAGGSPMTSYIARRIAHCFDDSPGMSELNSNLLLSAREREVIEMLARGFLYKEIAETMSISIRTVDCYIRRIYEKLHVRSRSQAVAKYVNFPLVKTHRTRSQ